MLAHLLYELIPGYSFMHEPIVDRENSLTSKQHQDLIYAQIDHHLPLFFPRKYSRHLMQRSRSTSPADERQILESWQPEPLIPDVDYEGSKHLLNPHVVSSKPGKHIFVDGVKCLDFATNNYLGLSINPRLEQASIEALKKYGVGSCGPRAFYGTMDVHLELEEAIANFLGVQEAVVYSFGFSTIASAIPSYAKVRDTIFVDENVNFFIQQGLIASRSKIVKFRHNDTDHLRDLMSELAKKELEKFGKTNKIRTFIIVEGFYAKTGQLCPLKELVDIKKQFKARLFIDESRSFGVLGYEGKGVTQHFNINIHDVDLVMASMENALCSFGGFCAGSSYIIDHQRLAGTGYCFSASLPPFQTRVALESLKIIQDDPSVVHDAQQLFLYADQKLKDLTRLRNISHPLCPIKLLVIDKPSEGNETSSYCKQDEITLGNICSDILAEENLAISLTRYSEEEKLATPVPAIRLMINGCLGNYDITRVVRAIERSSNRFQTDAQSSVELPS